MTKASIDLQDLRRRRRLNRPGVSGDYTYIEYARFADDLVILIDAYKRHDWLVGAAASGL
jgi:RNA-directed DNA polymerase